MVKKALSESLEIPFGVTVTLLGSEIKVKGSKGEVVKNLESPLVKLTVENNQIMISSNGSSKRDKTMLKTYKALLKNAIYGCQNGYHYKLKICSGHFPMNVSVTGNTLEIKNFLGEKVPRKVTLMSGVVVKVEGSEISVDGIDKERTGQVAADIEQSTRRPGFDKRIFQDGIYLVEKAGKQI